MILGVGFDIVDLTRVRAADHEAFAAGILTPGERARHAGGPSDFAVAFAMKEALMKALGCGLSRGWRWQDIELDDGRIRLRGDLRAFALCRGVETIRSTYVCTKLHALACVVVEGSSDQGGTP